MSHLRLHRFADDDVSAIDLAMMERAIELAAEAARLGEVPVGAVVYRGDQILAEAANNREATSDPTGHAELVAMSRAGRRLGDWRLSGCSLAVTLEPCPMCAGAMVNARIERLVYGADDPKAGACRTLYRIPTDGRLNHRVQVIGGVLADRCRAQLQSFFKHRRQQAAGPGVELG
jgi:tRNA(adenine34) deaminase